MNKWIRVWTGTDGTQYEDRKALLSSAHIRFHAKGINVKHPAGAGAVGAGTNSRSGFIQNGTALVSEMEQEYRYEIEIQAKDYSTWRTLTSQAE